MSGGIDLLLAMERPDGEGESGGYLTSQELILRMGEAGRRGEGGEQEGVSATGGQRGQLQGVLAGAEVLTLACSGELDCGDRVCEQALVVEGGAMVSYSTPTVSFITPRYSRTESCTCPGQYKHSLLSSYDLFIPPPALSF